MVISALNPWLLVHGQLPGRSRSRRGSYKSPYPNSSVKAAAENFNTVAPHMLLDYHFRGFGTWWACSRDDHFEYEVYDNGPVLNRKILFSLTEDNTNYPYLVIYNGKFVRPQAYCIGIWNLIKGNKLEHHINAMCGMLIADEIHGK